MKRQKRVGSRLFMALIFLFLYAPIFLLIVYSFNAGNSSVTWKGFSLTWYVRLLSDRVVMQSVYVTLWVSLLATIISTVAGTFAAIGFHQMKRRWRTPLLTINNIPMMNADIVTGVSLCLFFVATVGLWNAYLVPLGFVKLYLGFGTLLLAHISFNIPYVILNVMPKLRQLDGNLVDAAQDLGCTWLQAFWKVILPEIMPGIISGALIAFTMSIDDFVISYFTAGSSISNLAMTIYGMTKRRVTPEVNAISTLLFGAVLLLLIITNIRDAHLEKKASKHDQEGSH